ncbi:MAG: hypothetical protein HGA48_00260 [Candidatus Yonathbacteria bacterium]|nr:hypothetical protein [Candidatus Yonathbacteria bacterium]
MAENTEFSLVCFSVLLLKNRRIEKCHTEHDKDGDDCPDDADGFLVFGIEYHGT